MKKHYSGFGKVWMVCLALIPTALMAFDRPIRELVLYYPLGTGAQGEVRDGSGMQNSGVVSAITVSNSPSLVSMQQTRELTIAVWIKPNSLPHEFPELVDKGGNQLPGAYGGYELTLNANGDNDLVFISGTCAIDTLGANGSLINNHLGEWIHVAFTINDKTKVAKFYVNGVDPLDEYDYGTYFNTTNALNFDVPNNLYVGKPDPAHNQNRSNFDGSMQNLMIFNRALSGSEINNILQSTKPKGVRIN